MVIPSLPNGDKMVNAGPQDAGVKGKASILVVDDEPIVSEYLCRFLAKDGFEVKGVLSAKEALQEFGCRHYDVILSDIRMPEMSGIDLFYHLRKQDQGLAQRMVFITADPEAPDAVALVRDHGCLLVSKPLEPEQLHQALRHVLASGKRE